MGDLLKFLCAYSGQILSSQICSMFLMNPSSLGENRTRADQRSCAEEQQIDRLLFTLYVTADMIHGADQTRVCLDEGILPFRVQSFAFGCNAMSGFL